MSKIAKTLLDVLGMDSFVLLIKNMGGMDIYIPRRDDDCQLAQRLIAVLGDRAAASLMANFGGERLYVPKCDDQIKYQRNTKFIEAVINKIEGGMLKTRAVQQCAKDCGFSERWGYQILSNNVIRDTSKALDDRQLTIDF